MHLCRPIRGPRLSLTTCGMCRSTPSPSKSRSFCTCKITSYLHIPHPLKVPQFQRFAQKQNLTPLACADTQMRGEGVSLLKHQCETPSPEVTVFSVVYTLPIWKPFLFSALRTPGVGGGSNSVRTGRIPDTLDRGHS